MAATIRHVLNSPQLKSARSRCHSYECNYQPNGQALYYYTRWAQQSLLSPLKLPEVTLSGAGWSPTLIGTAGNDVFDPGANHGGTATMIGGGGNDVFYVHGFDDVVIAQVGGINTVITDYGWGAYTLPDNVQNLIYEGGASYANGWITLTVMRWTIPLSPIILASKWSRAPATIRWSAALGLIPS